MNTSNHHHNKSDLLSSIYITTLYSLPFTYLTIPCIAAYLTMSSYMFNFMQTNDFRTIHPLLSGLDLFWLQNVRKKLCN